jgi:membrane protease subunit HflK
MSPANEPPPPPGGPPHGHDHGPGESHRHAPPPGLKAPAPPRPPENFEGDEPGVRALGDALRSSFAIVKIAMIVMAVVFCFSGVFVVKPQQQAVVFRFGRLVGPPDHQLLGPGLHFAFPRPIDEVMKIPTTEIQTVRSTAGWYNVTPEQEAAGTEPSVNFVLDPATEGYTLTGDDNIIHIRATLRYLVKDPLAYMFNFVEASNIVQNVLNNALFYASARYPVDRVLPDVGTLKDSISSRVSQQTRALGVGIEIQQVDVQVRAPLQVKEAFQAVVTASQKKDSAVNAARGYANTVLSKAAGESNAVVSAGISDRARLLSDLESEANAVTNLAASYRDNGRLFYARHLAETMQRVLTNAQDKFYLREMTDGEHRQLRLELSKSPEKPPAPAPDTTAGGGK